MSFLRVLQSRVVSESPLLMCFTLRLTDLYPKPGFQPHGGVRPFHQKSTCLTQFTLGPYVEQIWSSYVQFRTNETCDLQRVVENCWARSVISLISAEPSTRVKRLCKATHPTPCDPGTRTLMLKPQTTDPTASNGRGDRRCLGNSARRAQRAHGSMGDEKPGMGSGQG